MTFFRNMGDFRSSLYPETAEQRLSYFKEQLSVHMALERRDEMSGIEPDYLSAEYAYGKLLKAHITFAEAQIKALSTSVRQGGEYSRSPERTSAPDHSETEVQPDRDRS